MTIIGKLGAAVIVTFDFNFFLYPFAVNDEIDAQRYLNLKNFTMVIPE